MAVGILGNRTLLSIVPISGIGVGPQQTVLTAIIDTTADGLTAVAGGSQTTSLLLTAKMNRITTVVTAADGVLLPPAIAGMRIDVRNAAASNACNVFPASATQGGVSGGDKINALAQNAAFSLTTAGTASFRCYTTGTWITG